MLFIQVIAPTERIRDAALFKAYRLEEKGEIKVLTTGRSNDGEKWTFCYADHRSDRTSFLPPGEHEKRAVVGFIVEVTVSTTLSIKKFA